MSGFSSEVLEALAILLAIIWIARYWPVNDFWLVLKAWIGLFGECGGVLGADHVRFDPRYPYRASTDIIIKNLVRTSSNCACVRITRFFLYENMIFFPTLQPLSVFTLIRREASAWKREVG